MVDVRGRVRAPHAASLRCPEVLGQRSSSILCVGIPGFSRGWKRISRLLRPVMSARMFRLRRGCCCVPDQEPWPAVGVFRGPWRDFWLSASPGGARVRGGAEDLDPPGWHARSPRELVQACRGQRDRLQEVARRQGIGLGAQDVRPVALEARSGAGSIPSSWRISQTVEATASQRRPGHSRRGHQRLPRRPRMKGDRVGAADILRRLVRPSTAHPSTHDGGSVPACSLTRYRAYQSGQFGSSAPMRVSCSP